MAIVDTRHTDHVDESLAAADITLSEAALKDIDAITSATAPVVGHTPETL